MKAPSTQDSSAGRDRGSRQLKPPEPIESAIAGSTAIARTAADPNSLASRGPQIRKPLPSDRRQRRNGRPPARGPGELAEAEQQGDDNCGKNCNKVMGLPKAILHQMKSFGNRATPNRREPETAAKQKSETAVLT
ncbi:MAG: hypothetical protein FP826_15345 [Sphingomonadales bacterium]|nr:hypothetical protein [Sphingomonadales bacterium]MBU3992976.1 hypothetical protein [Alphaproteobacteria bacterium]